MTRCVSSLYMVRREPIRSGFSSYPYRRLDASRRRPAAVERGVCLELEGDSSVRVGAEANIERALAGRRVDPTGTLEGVEPSQQSDHVAQPDAEPAIVPMTWVQPARS
jgi:hypothetical protein